ncbi:hypothetical protein VTN00DRAFT_2403 [Thermoascus crustaceus]|uniref:uncharacterized protein n=1 Tax=Thermoascus crustaceus TaxID=5088 RepID=UPI003743D691
MLDYPRIYPSMLPDGANAEMDFRDTSFFKVNDQLPTPAQVRAMSNGADETHVHPPPVIFEDLNLLVKFGQYVYIAEAQCLWAIRRVLHDEVPVPEVFGWRVDDGMVFIYMELIRGDTLKDRWNSLSVADRAAVCDQLKRIVTSLRRVKQDTDQFIGSINRQPLLDTVFDYQLPAGPFTSARLFHDWLSWLPQSGLPDDLRYNDPYRSLLPDEAEITLTHGDLHRGNIIISNTSPPEVLAVIDWGQAGWYPDYWEYCKACYTSHYGGEWRIRWIPEFISPRPDENEVFVEYIMQLGGF